MENLGEITKIIGGLLAVIIGVFKLIAFFTPENRKNLRSNVSEFKSVATAKKKHLVIAILSLMVAIMFFVFFLKDKLGSGTAVNSDMSAVNIGDIVKFGGTNKKIEWIVIEKNKHDLTMLSRNCIEAKPYNEGLGKEKKLDWKKSTLKSWLNGEFADKNFQESDRRSMVEFREGGFVSLLDKKLATKLGKENKDWMVCSFDSAEKADAKIKGWWLQTPKGECGMFVNSSGKVESSCTKYFDNRADKNLFVRPVIRKKM